MPQIEAMKLGGKGKGKKKELPKLIDDTNNKRPKAINMLFSMVNKGYQLYYIVTDFCKKIMWFGSCVGLMYFFPIFMEYMGE